MFLRIFFICSIVLIDKANGAMKANDLARCIMSAASVGNRNEQVAIGFACQRNRNHNSNQNPTAAIIQLAKNILQGKVRDPTNGANHWYSPRSMPSEKQKHLCKKPVGSGRMDCDGGLESVCGSTKSYRPDWAKGSGKVNIPGVRDCYFKFFKL